jgi:protein-S-isoprenylcysteine O-methyltransferase Ste14
VVVFGGLAFLSSIVAKESGEQLLTRVPAPAEHIDAGNAMPGVAVTLLGLITVFWLVDRGIPMNRARPLWLSLIGVVVILVALGSLYWTFRVGHTGAEAVWKPIVSKG